jgi:hypothetical protein
MCPACPYWPVSTGPSGNKVLVGCDYVLYSTLIIIFLDLCANKLFTAYSKLVANTGYFKRF